MAPQSIGTKGRSRRSLWAWMALATSSFPVPVSPCTSRVVLAFATRLIMAKTCRMALALPSISADGGPGPAARPRRPSLCFGSWSTDGRRVCGDSVSILAIRHFHTPQRRGDDWDCASVYASFLEQLGPTATDEPRGPRRWRAEGTAAVRVHTVRVSEFCVDTIET